MDERKTAAVFKALCDENRIRILKLLTGGEKCACKLLDELNVLAGDGVKVVVTVSADMDVLPESVKKYA